MVYYYFTLILSFSFCVSELGSEMEAALSLMAGTVDTDTLETRSNTTSNAMDLVANENQDANINMGGGNSTQQQQDEDAKNILQTGGAINIQGLETSSFMSGIFSDGPLLPSLMSPMLSGGMLGSFSNISSANTLQQTGTANNSVNSSSVTSSTDSNANTQPSNNPQSSNNVLTGHNFVNFSQDNLFISPSIVSTSNNNNAQSTSNLLDSALQTANITSQSDVQEDGSDNVIKTEGGAAVGGEKISVTTTNTSVIQPDAANVLQLPFNNNNSVNAQLNFPSSQQLESQMGIESKAVHLYKTENTVQQQQSNNATNVIINSNTQANVNVNSATINLGNAGGNNFVETTMGTFNAVGQQGTLIQTIGNSTGVSGNIIMPGSQKGIVNVGNVLNPQQQPQQQIASLQQQTGNNQSNNNVVLNQMHQGMPVGSIQGTLMLHNNQLILLPNNQMVNNAPGLTLNSNMAGNVINQGSLQTQGVVAAGQQAVLTGPGGAVQNIINTGQGTGNGSNQITVAGNMQNIIGGTATGGQKQNNNGGVVARVGVNQQVITNTGNIGKLIYRLHAASWFSFFFSSSSSEWK